MRKTILMVMLMLPTWTAQAQGFYYHSILPDGRTVIGDKPAPGAKEVRKIPLTGGNVSAPLSTPEQQQKAASAQSPLGETYYEVVAAERNLAAAKAALEAGREPLPGERIGIKSGGTRLTDAYQQRLQLLEKEVSAAQKQLNDANARRNAVR